MGVFNRFEKGLERAVNGAFAKAFKSEVQPVEIASALRKAADERAAVVGRGRTLVPNSFIIELGATDHDRLFEFSEDLASEFTTNLVDYAGEQGYAFVGPVTVSFHEVPDLDTGVFRIQASSTKGPAPQAAAPRPIPQPETGFGPPRIEAPPVASAPDIIWLDIGGQRYDLSPGQTCLGRGDEADIIIDDPGVSRRHAELTRHSDAGGGGVTLRDLGSTNGTFVDAHRITSVALTNGSQITLGRTRVIFRQDPA